MRSPTTTEEAIFSRHYVSPMMDYIPVSTGIVESLPDAGLVDSRFITIAIVEEFARTCHSRLDAMGLVDRARTMIIDSGSDNKAPEWYELPNPDTAGFKEFWYTTLVLAASRSPRVLGALLVVGGANDGHPEMSALVTRLRSGTFGYDS